jgi:hypothetical protein
VSLFGGGEGFSPQTESHKNMNQDGWPLSMLHGYGGRGEYFADKKIKYIWA